MGCTDKEPDGPHPLAVEPRSGIQGSETTVRVSGEAFHPALFVSFNDKTRSNGSTAFAARLGTTPLNEVRYLKTTELQALVPAGLSVGTYDLTVIDPRGKTGMLASAFTVASPADAGAEARPDRGLDLDLDAKPEATADSTRPDTAIPDLPPRDTGLPDGPIGSQVATVAGTGTPGFADGPPGSAQFFDPTGIAFHAGTIYVGDYGNHRVRAITQGTVTTLAGTGKQGYADGPAASAELNHPAGVAVDGAGAVYVADSANDVIRVIQAGAVTTFAGSGLKGSADGNAKSATFNYPHGIDVSGGTVYVADAGNHRVRLISGNTVTTLAGSAQGYADGPTSTALFSNPKGISVAGTKVYVADSGNNCIRLIESGTVTTVAGSSAQGMIDGSASAARFWNPVDVAAAGTRVFISDQSNHRIRSLESGSVSTVAGLGFGFRDGPAKTALFYYPQGLALGPAGELYVADQTNHRIRVITF
jgi:DNA-binding beta-propeller fold protein YncE